MHLRKFKYVVYFTFLSGCFVGFFFQAWEVCLTYFKYKTESKIEFVTREDEVTPIMVVCYRYLDILNWTNNNTYEDYNAYIRDQSTLNVREIFDLTPQVNETISRCGGRLPNSYRWDFFDDECYKQFEIVKFLFAEMVCYSFAPNNLKSFNLKHVADAFHYTRILYRLTMGPKFDSAVIFMPMTHKPDSRKTVPTLSKRYARRIRRFEKNDHHIVCDVYFMRTELILLEPPYDTMCVMESGNPNLTMGRFRCLRKCLIQEFKKFGRVPFTEIVNEPSPLKQVSPKDLNDTEMMETVNQSERYCNDMCRRLSCHYSFHVTDYTEMWEKKTGFSTTFQVLSPQSPTTFIKYSPKYNLLDFITYVCSCFGVWFGLSVWSLRPSEWKRLLQLAKRRCLRRKSRHHRLNGSHTRNIRTHAVLPRQLIHLTHP